MQPGILRALARDKRAATGAVVALAMPALLGSVGFGIDWALITTRESQLQAIADAAATAGDQVLLATDAGEEDPNADTSATGAAIKQATDPTIPGTIPGSLVANDVEIGWYEVNTKQFGKSFQGQEPNTFFNNAVRVTTREQHQLIFGAFLGIKTLALSRVGMAYKCSNTNYPISLIQNDQNPPQKPAIYLMFPDPKDQSQTPVPWVYDNPDGRLNPVYKFYSPTDHEDVSFVLFFNDGSKLQVDTYCRGTFLVAPDAFDVRGYVQNKTVINAQIYRGSTNDSFDLLPVDPVKYPLDHTSDTVDYGKSAGGLLTLLQDYGVDTSKLKLTVTSFPSSLGWQNWVSNSTPTPDRRTTLVDDCRAVGGTSVSNC